MLAAGLPASLFPMADLAVMGLAEVLPRVLSLRQRLAQAVADIAATRPDLVVTIDSPGFTLRVLKRIGGLGLKRVHYVAPQVWAWREKRVREFPGLWDSLLCLLPFEEEFFARHGLPVRFVGHPVLQSGADHGNAQRFRDRHDIAPRCPGRRADARQPPQRSPPPPAGIRPHAGIAGQGFSQPGPGHSQQSPWWPRWSRSMSPNGP